MREDVKIKLHLDKKGLLHISCNDAFNHSTGLQMLNKAREIMETQQETMNGQIIGKT